MSETTNNQDRREAIKAEIAARVAARQPFEYLLVRLSEPATVETAMPEKRELMNDKITILEDDDYDLDDDLPSSLDLEGMPRAVEQERKYRARARHKQIRLAPDLAEVFDSSDAVNEALRTLIRLNRAEKKAA